MKKGFKYILRDRESNKTLIEQEVVFGSEEKPFPKDWKDSHAVQVGLQDYKNEFINQHLRVEIEEL